MEKRQLSLAILTSFALILSLTFISAYYSSDSFSFSDLLNEIGPEDMTIMLVFGISLILISWSLNRALKNRKLAGGIAFIVSFGIAYGINRYNIDLTSALLDIGINQDILTFLIVLLGIVIAIFTSLKFGLGKTLCAIGAIFAIIGLFTDLVRESGVLIFIGIAFLVVGGYFWNRRRKKEKASSLGVLRLRT
jgi:hypothetical protein